MDKGYSNFSFGYIAMGNYDKNSWKEKIDPNIDKPIKAYLIFLRTIYNLPNDGQISVKDEFKESINKNSNFQSFYKHEFKKEMLGFHKGIGLINEEELRMLKNLLFSINKYNNTLKKLQKTTTFQFFTKLQLYIQTGKIKMGMKSLQKLAEKLPEEESRKYYIGKIKGFTEDMHKKHFFQIQEDFISVAFTLIVRNVIVKLEEMSNTEDEQAGVEHLKDPIVLNQIMGFLYSVTTQIAHQKNMSDLLDDINKGDDNSIYKAVVVDKTLIYYEPVQKRIFEAQISGDIEFRKKLSKGIAKKPLESIGQHGETYATLCLFWKMELYKLTYSEIHYLLTSCGLHPPSYPDAFNKFMQRHFKQK